MSLTVPTSQYDLVVIGGGTFKVDDVVVVVVIVVMYLGLIREFLLHFIKLLLRAYLLIRVNRTSEH